MKTFLVLSLTLVMSACATYTERPSLDHHTDRVPHMQFSRGDR